MLKFLTAVKGEKMEKKYDVAAMGELLIDFTENGLSSQGNPVLEANPGGAPCNVLAMLSKLGHRTGFIGKVGKDMFGEQLERAITEAGIDTSGLVKTEEVHTTLAFVHTLKDGDRDFSFYRNPGADMMLDERELNANMLQNAKIFHFGSLSMTHELCRKATKAAIGLAKKSDALISFDPNLREPLWESPALAKEQISYGISVCDVLKISDNEIVWFTGKADYQQAVKKLFDQYEVKLIMVTLGKDGSMAFTRSSYSFAPAYSTCRVIETTGAGDTFCGTALHYILEKGWKEFSETELHEMLCAANAAASIITTRKGALRVMPDLEEIQAVRDNEH